MNKKISIAIVFVLAVACVSGYFLWQIDRHEKALVGQAWLNPVPSLEWKAYLSNKDTYDKFVKTQLDNNRDLVDLVKEYNSRRSSSAVYGFLDFQWEFSKGVVPKELQLRGFAADQLKSERNKEFQQWQKVVNEIESYKYDTPVPSNPPPAAINQSISALYRYMAMLDSVLLLGLVLFLWLYKEPVSCKKDINAVE